MKIPIRQYWNLLVSYLKPQWPVALVLAALILCNIGLQLVNPQIMRTFIDTTQAGGEGTGLGLYLVEEIINEHRGCIAVENRPEGGARFSIWLPLERAGPAEQEAS